MLESISGPVEELRFDGVLLAIIVRSAYESDGLSFFTNAEASMQLGYMKHPAKHVIIPHVHEPVPRTVDFTQEVVFVRSGLVRIDFYSRNQESIGNRILRPGDVVLLCEGGHGFEMLEDTEMIEVKQGPYVGEQDKSRFEPALNDGALNGE